MLYGFRLKMSDNDDKDENVGQRWYEYKKDNWSRTSVSSKVKIIPRKNFIFLTLSEETFEFILV